MTDDQDGVFASDVKKGKQLLWPQNVMVDYLRPAAKNAGITRQIGSNLGLGLGMSAGQAG
jgi:hypothetical protein